MDKKEIRELEQLFWDREVKRGKRGDKFSERDTPEIIEKDILLRKLTLSLGDTRGKEILDYGCGIGNLSVYVVMKGAYVKGFDISSEMLKVARANAEENNISGKRNFLCWSSEDLSCRNISFGLVVRSYVLEHVDTKRAMSGELHRILKARENYFHRNLGQESSLSVGENISSERTWHS